MGCGAQEIQGYQFRQMPHVVLTSDGEIINTSCQSFYLTIY
jgi:hypothetical protein